MSSFQVLIKRDAEAAPPLWQEGCPLLVETWQISKNLLTNEVWLQLRIRNVSNQPVTASIVKFKGTGLDGKVDSRTFELPQTTLHPGLTFEFHPALLGNKEVNEASVFVESVELEDKSTWSNTKETNVVPIERKKISLNDKQAEARAKLLEEEGCTKSSQAKKCQFESHENWWLCACGQLNLGTEKCNACSIPKQETNAFEDLGQIEETRKQIEKAKVQLTKKELENCSHSSCGSGCVRSGVCRHKRGYTQLFLKNRFKSCISDKPRPWRSNVLPKREIGVDRRQRRCHFGET